MTDGEICTHVAAVETQLPETAISARLALSLVFGEIARLQAERDALVAELARRPKFQILQGGKS